MPITQLLDGQTGTGTSTPKTVGEIKGDRLGAGSSMSIIISGITDGEVEVQFGPTDSGPWLTPSDGSGTVTADDVLSSPASEDLWVRIEVTDATDVDIDVWAA